MDSQILKKNPSSFFIRKSEGEKKWLSTLNEDFEQALLRESCFLLKALVSV